MTKSVITGKNADAILELYAQLPALSAAVKAALKTHGMGSPEFLKADAALGKAINHIQKIRGLGEASWL